MSERTGFTLWLTGLSGSGKTTISKGVAEELRRRGQPVEILDGDEVREYLSSDLGFEKADRDRNVKRIGYVAHLLARHGVGVITAAISPYRDTRKAVRELHGPGFVEVHVKTSLETCIQRDVKGLYKRALNGEIPHFTGISDPYEEPEHPEVVIETEGQTVAESVTVIIQYLEEAGYLKPKNVSGIAV
ncbi:adenylyl-sulfate kinase [Heliobacterium chlorum]|uniref:Adenylyl-sulfate kinase n=1 Tax=Heliobacterium chlorum TaxID=2698 RepID=A0ABR7T3G6_HELCL|nr:adenylyl-sulfate kinase [Heliobacterium chlorum]